MSATSKRNRALQAGIEPVTGKDLHLEADMAIDMAAVAPVQTEDEQESDGIKIPRPTARRKESDDD